MKLLNILCIIAFVLFTGELALAQDYSAWLERCEPYRNQVMDILKSEGVSTNYYYLMVVESKCRDKAESKAGAQGYWQLMPSTSRHFGCLHPDNLECATKAAAKYIKSLEKRFKTFHEVIAAWNMGGHNYSRIGKKSAEAIGLIQRTMAIKKESER